MNIKKLTVKNWKCFDRKQSWTFKNKELIVSANGTGKSSRFEAIRFAIWGKVPPGFNMNTVRFDDEQDALVEIEFDYGSSFNPHNAKIKRQFGSKSVAEMFIDGELVAESVRTIEPIVNKIADFNISQELWTNSITSSSILQSSYFTDTILADRLEDPNNLIRIYKRKRFNANKIISSFDEEILDIEAIKKNIESMSSKLKDKGASNEMYKKATKVLNLYEHLLTLKKLSSKENVEKFNSSLFFTGKYSIQDAKQFVKDSIEQELKYLEFESMKKPKCSYEDTKKFKYLFNQFLANDLNSLKETIKHGIETKQGIIEAKSKLKEPAYSQEQLSHFKSLMNEFNVTNSLDGIKAVTIKLESYMSWKTTFENMVEPKNSIEDLRKFTSFMSSKSLKTNDLESIRMIVSKNLIEEQSKELNRFLGISREMIEKCVDESIQTGKCIFCLKKFDEKHKNNIEKELNKPGRNEKLIKKLTEEFNILSLFESAESVHNTKKYYEAKSVYDVRIKQADIVGEQLKKQIDDFKSLTLTMDEVNVFLDLWNDINTFKIEKPSMEKEIDNMKNQLETLNLYDSVESAEYDEMYEKKRIEYEIKKETADKTVEKLKDINANLDLFSTMEDYNNAKEYWNSYDSFHEAEKEVPNFKDIIASYDENNLKLWSEYEKEQENYAAASAQQERLTEINKLKTDVEGYKEKISLLQSYIQDATSYYTTRIIDKASEIVQTINSRYKRIFIDGKSFSAIVERDNVTGEQGVIGIVPVVQLSTGEKTMIALSLLFAVHDIIVPELPFLFDEVFSGLDKQNLEEVKNFLRKQRSQIFVISHDKNWQEF